MFANISSEIDSILLDSSKTLGERATQLAEFIHGLSDKEREDAREALRSDPILSKPFEKLFRTALAELDPKEKSKA